MIALVVYRFDQVEPEPTIRNRNSNPSRFTWLCGKFSPLQRTELSPVRMFLQNAYEIHFFAYEKYDSISAEIESFPNSSHDLHVSGNVSSFCDARRCRRHQVATGRENSDRAIVR